MILDDQPSMFQFTHPGRGATIGLFRAVKVHRVSIHAPREGCDRAYYIMHVGGRGVSIHAPREGCDCFV